MESKLIRRAVQVTALAVTMAAIFQELEKPKEEREWHGAILKIPYDFRVPTLERFKATYWNPANDHVFMPELFGVGWGINFHALMQKLRIMGEACGTEEDFLMPTKSIKSIIEQSAV